MKTPEEIIELYSNMAMEKILFVSVGGRAQMGRTFYQGISMGIKYVLDNLWIPIEKRTPPLEKDLNGTKWSKEVFVLLSNGDVSTDYYWKEETIDREGWYNRFNKVTHWMPIPKKPNRKSPMSEKNI